MLHLLYTEILFFVISTLKARNKIAADDILIFDFYLSKKIRLAEDSLEKIKPYFL